MSNNKDSYQSALVLTLLFPFAGLIYTLRNWRAWWAKNTFWLVCVYMGAVQIFCPEGTILGMGGDGGRYVLRLMSMYSDSTSFRSILSSYLVDPQIMDLYQPLVTCLVSKLTDNGHVLFAVFAFVFGYFYSRNIWYILDKLPNKKFGYLFILVTLYFLICPISQINGVRMWTALHVYVYGMMPFLLDNDKSKIWWVFLTPLIHFSFLYVTIFGLMWVILPYKIKTSSSIFLHIAFVFFFATLFIKSVDINTVGALIEDYAPESQEERLGAYISEDYMAVKSEQSGRNNWYVGASYIIFHWSNNILMLMLLPCFRRMFKYCYDLIHLYVFSLFFGGLANIMALVGSGGRFLTLFHMFNVPLFLIVAMSISKSDRFRKALYYDTILLFIPFVFNIRQLFDYYSITAILGNFITVFLWENNVTLIDLIKQVL